MGYAVYEDRDARDHGIRRWAGYGVPAECDIPECHNKIDRGLSYKCERGHRDEPDGEYLVEKDEAGNITSIKNAPGYDPQDFEDEGCGLYFCSDHLYATEKHDVTPKPDVAAWEHHMLRHESWAQWRADNPQLVEEMTARTASYQCTEDCEHDED